MRRQKSVNKINYADPTAASRNPSDPTIISSCAKIVAPDADLYDVLFEATLSIDIDNVSEKICAIGDLNESKSIMFGS